MTNLHSLQSAALMIALEYPALLEQMATKSTQEEDLREQIIVMLRAKRLLEINHPEEESLQRLYSLLLSAYTTALLDTDAPAESFPDGQEITKLLQEAGLAS